MSDLNTNSDKDFDLGYSEGFASGINHVYSSIKDFIVSKGFAKYVEEQKFSKECNCNINISYYVFEWNNGTSTKIIDGDIKNILMNLLIKFVEMEFKLLNDIKDTKSINTHMSTNTDNSNTSFVYIGKQLNEQGLYKIGMTKNLSDRLSTFRCGNCFIEFVMIKKCINAVKLESLLHKYFKHKKYQREWFKLDSDDLSLLEELGFVYCLSKNNEKEDF